MQFFEGLNLKDRDLQFADLGFSRLFKVDFEGANLQGAALSGANLQGAVLRWAEFQGADLGKANLQGADLGDAFIGGTIFSETELILTNLQSVSCDVLKTDDWKKLREEIAKAIPEGGRRDGALKRLEGAAKKKKTLFDPPSPAQIRKEGAFDSENIPC
jgi:hypothetical protein